MAETAIGLFEDIGTAEAVEDALRANGLPTHGIRVIRKPVASGGASSIPSPDSTLASELRSMGATQRECEAYVDGVQRGNVLVFATGSHAQSDTAIGVMNAYNPIELEEFASAQTGIHAGAMRTREGITLKGEEASVPEGITLKSEKERARSEGARVFSW
ncbi:MAG TPA: hypothetical protein VHZ52_14375 [Acidobacteriaceae bacterium]|jgi:hypothetical protein|nr:hypothetical protein [Acidobacteriaceae bacterium]